MKQLANLPLVLAGPLLRHVQADRLMLWVVTSRPTLLQFRLKDADTLLQERTLNPSEQKQLQIGQHAYLQLLEIKADSAWPVERLLHYDLGIERNERIEGGDGGDGESVAEYTKACQWIADWAPHLCHAEHTSPHFVIHSRVNRILHGSCRKPHHKSDDGLRRVDAEIRACGIECKNRPALLLMTGDQVYVDDVAGPMLHAIHQLIDTLNLFDESVSGAVVDNARALQQHEHTYYRRTSLLPLTETNATLIERFFGGARKPVFTTANAENHLVSVSEMLAMYMLVWSPVPWTLLDLSKPVLPDTLVKRYEKERTHIARFVDGLPEAARALSHVSSYMIFDDHDVTDDWNLSQAWEETTYEHPFSRRIVGNALLAYALCQGWGNGPSCLETLMPACEELFDTSNLLNASNLPDTTDLPATSNLSATSNLVEQLDLPDTSNDKPDHNASDANNKLPSNNPQPKSLQPNLHDALINTLLDFRGWQYTLNTQPAIVVLDTRTHRWHRRSKPNKPSGLMDWEALTDFQQQVVGLSDVIVVSPAPVFGVKLIEIIQRIFTFFGKPLLVDAENWMAHHEAATVILSIFEHSKTPQTFVLLSGDVHYSFAYDVRLRYQTQTPAIWQITSSGIKNEFPVVLIEWLDRLNRWLFAPWSPLNLLTQRSAFRIWPRLPTGRSAGERLWNHSGIGDVRLGLDGKPEKIMQLNSVEGKTQFMDNRVEG